MSRLDEIQFQFREKLKIEANQKLNRTSGIPRPLAMVRPLNYLNSVKPPTNLNSFNQANKIINRNVTPKCQTSIYAKFNKPYVIKNGSTYKEKSSANLKPNQLIESTTTNRSRETRSNSITVPNHGRSLSVPRKPKSVISEPSNRLSNGLVHRSPGTRNPIASRSSLNIWQDQQKQEGHCCRVCGRRFNLKERLSKHEEICEKTLTKQRKKFDSSKQRFKGQPADQVKAFKTSIVQNSETNQQRKSNWRAKHEYFLAAIRAARGDGPPPQVPAEMLSEQHSCRYCNRKFNDDALGRHEPICEKISKKQINQKNKK